MVITTRFDNRTVEGLTAEQEAQQRFESLFFNNPAPMVLSTVPHMVFTDVNDAFLKTLGYARDEVIGRSSAELDLFVQSEHHGEAASMLLRDNRITSVELQIRHKNGNILDGLFSGDVVYIHGQQYLLTVMLDITYRKSAERMIRESEERFHSLFDNSLDGILLTTPSGRILAANRAAQQILGRTEDEIRDAGRHGIVLQDEALARALEERKRTGRWHGVLTYLRKDGESLPVEVSSCEFDAPDGQAKTCTSFRDITARKLAEIALQESEKKYHQLFHLGSDALFLVDRETYEILDVNSAASELYGFERKEMLKMKAVDLSADPGISEGRIKDAISHDPVRWHRKKSGTVFPVEIMATYFELSDRPVVLASMRDITGRLRSEEELVRHRDRLEELVKERTLELIYKTQRLEELNTALKVLLQQRNEDRKEVEQTYVSNIQNLVLPYVKKLKETNLDKNQKSYLGIMESYVDKIVSPFLIKLQQFNLTPREAQVASLVKEGKSTKEIAKIMMVSTGTIDIFRKNIRKKVGLTNVKSNLQSKLKSLE
jgi:PAS domain S-box-containing protein